MSSFNLKALIRDIAKRNLPLAKESKVLLLLAIDSRIPEQLIGDKARLKPLISCFIMNGINQCRQPGTCTVMAALMNEDKDVYRIRFAVRDDGKGLSPEEILELYNPLRSTGNSPVSLHPFKLIVEAHRGKIDVKSNNVGKEFSFEIPFRLSHDAVANVEVLNKSFNAHNPANASPQQQSSADWITPKAVTPMRRVNVSIESKISPREKNLVPPKNVHFLTKSVDAVPPPKPAFNESKRCI